MAFITVTGTITRKFYEDKGFEITEQFKTRNGEIAKRTYTAWFEYPQSHNVGQSGTFSGQLSAVIENWKNADGTPKLDRSGKPGQSVRISINGAEFKPDADTQSRSKMDVPQTWSEIDSELPF